MTHESRNVYTESMGVRLRRAFGFLFNHIQRAPDHVSDHYRPSAQRDVGKSANQAADVQLVILGIQDRNGGWDSEGNYYASPEEAEKLLKTELDRSVDMGYEALPESPEAA